MEERNALIEEAKRLGVEEVVQDMVPLDNKPTSPLTSKLKSNLDKKGIRNRKKKRKMAKNSRKRNRK